MKTIRMTIVGMFFLCPSLLPVIAKAGGGPPHPLSPYFDRRTNPYFDRDRSPFNNTGDRLWEDRHSTSGSGFRPYDPFTPNHLCDPSDPSNPSSPPGGGNSVPLDGGLILLLSAGIVLGARMLYVARKRQGFGQEVV